jgi:hypothetical protein
MLEKPGQPKAETETGNNVPALDRPDRGNSRAFSISRLQRQCDAETVAARHAAPTGKPLAVWHRADQRNTPF